jgi:diguanylate cyclase (GGDEF)-like protein
MRLVSCVRSSDCVARVGGDEFLILLEDVGDKSEIENIAGKIISTLSQRIDIEGDIIQLGSSIGISVFPENGESVNELKNKADQAMYGIKNSGKNNFAFA